MSRMSDMADLAAVKNLSSDTQHVDRIVVERPLRMPGYHGRRFENLVELQNRRVRVGLRRKYDIGGFFVLIEVADSDYRFVGAYHGNHGHLATPQLVGRPRESSSASRFSAGASGFFILSQSGDRPER
jgi:hypothetical protein